MGLKQPMVRQRHSREATSAGLSLHAKCTTVNANSLSSPDGMRTNPHSPHLRPITGCHIKYIFKKLVWNMCLHPLTLPTNVTVRLLHHA